MVHRPWVLNKHDQGSKHIHQLKLGRSGSIAFGNDSSIKILGRGVVSLGSENVKATHVFRVEYLRHNIYSVNEMCD